MLPDVHRCTGPWLFAPLTGSGKVLGVKVCLYLSSTHGVAVPIHMFAAVHIQQWCGPVSVCTTLVVQPPGHAPAKYVNPKKERFERMDAPHQCWSLQVWMVLLVVVPLASQSFSLSCSTPACVWAAPVAHSIGRSTPRQGAPYCFP
jgi:hypothetical protein